MPTTRKAPVKTGAAKSQHDFQPVFDELKQLMEPYAGKLRSTGRPGDFQLIGPPVPLSKGKDVWFGAVKINKNYVSYHLMPVYAFPDLLDGLSPRLKKRMQGKSCFNFTAVDKALFAELKRLTKAGFERFKQAELI